MAKFQVHYLVTVQRNNDALAETGVADIRIDGPRSEESDLRAVKRAIEVANALSVGADGRCEFEGYTVYVTHYRAFGASTLLAKVERRFAWDSDADYTSASAHCGNMPYAQVEALNA